MNECINYGVIYILPWSQRQDKPPQVFQLSQVFRILQYFNFPKQNYLFVDLLNELKIINKIEK